MNIFIYHRKLNEVFARCKKVLQHMGYDIEPQTQRPVMLHGCRNWQPLSHLSNMVVRITKEKSAIVVLVVAGKISSRSGTFNTDVAEEETFSKFFLSEINDPKTGNEYKLSDEDYLMVA